MRQYKVARNVGKRIQLIHKKLKLIQEEVADRVGVHLSTLGRIERGESNKNLLKFIGRKSKIN